MGNLQIISTLSFHPIFFNNIIGNTQGIMPVQERLPDLMVKATGRNSNYQTVRIKNNILHRLINDTESVHAIS